MNEAYLLNVDGKVIPVLNHPDVNFEFESVLDLIEEHGLSRAKTLVKKYRASPSDNLKLEIATVYHTHKIIPYHRVNIQHNLTSGDREPSPVSCSEHHIFIIQLGEVLLIA